MAALMSMEAARLRAVDGLRPLAACSVALSQARGLCLAADVVSAAPLPPFRRAMMDGAAVRVADAGRVLPVLGTVLAGAEPTALPTDGLLRIMTGAACPAGTEAVVPLEQLRSEAGGGLRLPESIRLGQHVAEIGSDCSAGTVIAAAGDRLGPQLIAALAAVGCTTPLVRPRPRVVVLATGSETVPADQEPPPGRIRDSNGPMLAALVAQAGAELIACRAIADDAAALRQAVLQAVDEADCVVTSGGVSVGDADLLPRLVQELGAEVLVHGVEQKPGKPLLLARLGGVPIVGLPGNPLAALVGFRFYAEAILAVLAGARVQALLPARLAVTAPPRPGRPCISPAVLGVVGDGELLVWPQQGTGSADIVIGHQASVLVLLPAGLEPLPAGSRVLLLPEASWHVPTV